MSRSFSLNSFLGCSRIAPEITRWWRCWSLSMMPKPVICDPQSMPRTRMGDYPKTNREDAKENNHQDKRFGPEGAAPFTWREAKYTDVVAAVLSSSSLRLRGCVCSSPAKKQKSRPKKPHLWAAKWEPMTSGSSGFHFGLIDIKVCEDLLNILVLLQGLHQADHLLRCFPFQFDCRHRNHRQFSRQ